MKKKYIAIIVMLFLLPIAIAALISVSNDGSTSTSPGFSIEACETLSYSGEDKINLVFFGERNKAIEYTEFFLETSPFNANKEEFNFYHIQTHQPTCEIYKGIAILCYSKELIKKSASCPNDYIIVLQESGKKLRSSSYLNVLSINTDHPKSVLTHEFGHSFANLAEEYTPAKIPTGSRNCVQSCEEFNGEEEGCFEECSEATYIRSIESGVMRTLSSNNYGQFNENLILDKLNSKSGNFFTGNVIQKETNCFEQEYYLIEAKYNNKEKNIELVGKSLEEGCFGNNGAGPFKYYLEKEDGSIIPGTDFSPELIFTDAPGEKKIEGETFESDKNFLLKIPSIKDVKTLSINLGNKKLLETNLNDVGLIACTV